MSPTSGRPALTWTSFLRFVFVGSVCFLCALGGVYYFTEVLRWHYLLSTAVAAVCANVLGWLLNRHWTFALRVRRSAREFLRYALVNACGMGFSLMLVALLVSGLGMHYLLACVVVAVVMAVINFNVHGRWSLHQQADSSS